MNRREFLFSGIRGVALGAAISTGLASIRLPEIRKGFADLYRREVIAGFEVYQSLLRETVTRETPIKGKDAAFLVAGEAAILVRA